MEGSFVLLPGDRRQAALCTLLEERGCTVQLLPPPAHWARENLPPPGTFIPVAHADEALREQCAALGFHLLEYGARADYKAENGAITAENALRVAMEEGRLLRGRRALVFGWGAVGKPLCLILRGVGARVTASARKHAHLAEIQAAGFDAVHTAAPEEALPTADWVFNTVPAEVLPERLLRLLPQDAVVIDLAGAPGGVDRDAARLCGVRVVPARGLPGKMTPHAAAEAILNAVCAGMEEGV